MYSRHHFCFSLLYKISGANRAFGTTAIAAEGAGRITTVIGAVVDVQVSHIISALYNLVLANVKYTTHVHIY